MRERDELLREAEEEVDVGDREGFELGGSILVTSSADVMQCLVGRISGVQAHLH